MTIGIYRIYFPSGRCYIGQSNNVERRIDDHFRDIDSYNHKNKRVRAAVLAEGRPNWELLCSCGLAELNEMEVEWIAYYDSFANGLNQNKGGGYNRPITPVVNPAYTIPSPAVIEDTESWLLPTIIIVFILCILLIVTYPPILGFALLVVILAKGFAALMSFIC